MVTWNERDDAREAFIAGSSGARRNTGTTKDTRDAFTRGQTSAKEFKRALWKRRNPKQDEPRGFGGDAAQLLMDTNLVKKGIESVIDWIPHGAKEKFLGLPKAAIDAATRNFEEDKAISRDYGIPWFKGGNPMAVDRGTPVDQFLRTKVKDKKAYNQALRDDRLFTTNLDEMTGGDYETKAGYLALLNDPSRIKDMSPVRALNYMRSITGDPTNMGFDEFEAWRQAKGRTEEERGLTATEVAKKLLPEYYAQANEMYGQGFIGNAAAANYGDSIEVPPFIKQATGTASIDPTGLTHEQLLALNKDPYYDRVRETVSPFPDDDYLTGDNVLFDQFADEPQNILTSEDLVASEPYTWSALDMYPGLNIPFLKDQYFPNKTIEDITREDIRGLNQYERSHLGYAG